MLDLGEYLKQWFGKVPIGVELADFLQLRPTAQFSLCEWLDAPRATEAAVPDAVSDAEEAERTKRPNEPPMHLSWVKLHSSNRCSGLCILLDPGGFLRVYLASSS